MLRKIVIIDRDKNIAELLESCFKTEGYLTFATDSVDDALEHLDESIADILVVDSMLPDDGAHTLLRVVRQKQEGRNIPIALIVSSRDKKNESQGSLSNLFRIPIIIKKPYRISTLLRTIDSYFSPPETTAVDPVFSAEKGKGPAHTSNVESMVQPITTEPDDYIELIEPENLRDFFEDEENENSLLAVEKQLLAEEDDEEEIEELTEEVIAKNHILLVDDEPMILKILKQLLEDEGFDVSMTHKSTEAVKLVAQQKPDIVISDIMMPELDGYSLCRVIKSKPELAETKVILLTAKNLAQDKGEGFKSGADFFMQKPINRPKLITVVKNLLGLSD